MFDVVKSSELQTIWLPVANGQTIYVGQLVQKSSSGDYLSTFGSASGASTNKPLGVVVATNNKEPLYSSQYKTHYITGVQTQAAQLARKWQGAQGMWALGDPIPLVQVKLIGPQTQIKASLFWGSFGTALSTFNPAENNSSGNTLKRAEGSKSSVDYNTIFYCRQGANKGIYRVVTTSSNSSNVTTHNFNTYWPYPISTSDVFVQANICLGVSKIQIDSLGLFIDASQTYSSNYYTVIVEEINLEEAGKEYAIIRFV